MCAQLKGKASISGFPSDRKTGFCNSQKGLKDPNTIQEACPGLWEKYTVSPEAVLPDIFSTNFLTKIVVVVANIREHPSHVADQYVLPPSGQNRYNTCLSSWRPMTSLEKSTENTICGLKCLVKWPNPVT